MRKDAYWLGLLRNEGGTLARHALVTRASWFMAHSPCLATPSMRFLFIGSQFTLHASFPRSVALTQLRFTLLTVTSSQRDLHPQVCAMLGALRKNPTREWLGFEYWWRAAYYRTTRY